MVLFYVPMFHLLIDLKNLNLHAQKLKTAKQVLASILPFLLCIKNLKQSMHMLFCLESSIML
ncbi:hypothetical protein RchiOBHm_Chr2g0090841 [Rosa chinensis]|uniref:Uncharacterized protein n=1 Tax=Rosa chinensis TaxID=74649 RepID=A0A2P6RJL0_ROSCH|nr:hypothetical protein RchiOBHm_Chr2g0090841 [Rosa chinensis]